MGLKLATELSMRLGKIVLNLYSNFSDSENFYKIVVAPLQIPSLRIFKNICWCMYTCLVPVTPAM